MVASALYWIATGIFFHLNIIDKNIGWRLMAGLMASLAFMETLKAMFGL